MAFLDTQLHLNVPLTDLAISFRPDEKGWLWNRLLPPKPVTHISNYIRQIDRAALMSIPDMRSGAQGFLSEVQFKIGQTLSYTCVDYGIEVVRDRRERGNADAILKYDQRQLYTGMTKINNMLEKVAIKDTLRVAANYDANQVATLTAPDQWDNVGSPASDPIADIKAAVLAVQIQTGGARNGKIQVIMHAYTWNAIQLHPNEVARGPVHPSGAGILTIQAFEEIIFGKPGDPNRLNGEIIVSSSFYNVAPEGQPADMRSFIGPDCLVIYSEEASEENFGFGQAFMFANIEEGIDFYDKSGGIPIVVCGVPDPKRGMLCSDIDRILVSVDFKGLNPLGGYLLKNVIDGTNTAAYQNFLNN